MGRGWHSRDDFGRARGEDTVLSPQPSILRVGAGDTLESVLERVRASEAAELTLDVDERSPLLISVQHLHQLEEVAQERGVQVVIATPNSKLLNAARVFGISVVDRRADDEPLAPAAPLTGETSDPLDLPAAPDDPEGGAPAGDEPVFVVRPRRFTADEPSRLVIESGALVDDRPEEGGIPPAAPDDLPLPRRPLSRVVPGPLAGTTSVRLDPYGQPYGDEPDSTGGEGGDADPEREGEPGGFARSARVIRPEGILRDERPAPARAPERRSVGEEGWDDEYSDAGLYDDEDPDHEDRARPARAWGLAGVAALWTAGTGALRSRLDARRGATEGPAHEEDEYDYDDDAARSDEEDEDDGWDVPEAPLALSDADGDEGASLPDGGEWDEDAAPPPRATGRLTRVIRPLGFAGRRPVATVSHVPGAEPVHGRPGPLVVDAADLADHHGAAGVDEGDEPDDWDDEFHDTPRDDRRGGAGTPARRAALGPLLLIAVAVLLLCGAALYLLLARATVTLTARTGTVATTFNVVVGEIDPATPVGLPTEERIVVPAKRIVVPVSASASRPATGARLEPDVTAGGPVLLSNAAVEAVTVPRGTVLTATDGRTFTTLEGVVVPAADPFNSGAFGTATVRVAAGIRGSGGNADAGVVRGQLPSGIYYNNRGAPIAGGSDKRIPTVARQDLLAAQAAAEEAARAKGVPALAAALPPGATIMRDTAGVGGFTVEFSAEAGSDGESVTATVTAEATVLTQAPAEVEGRARAEVERRLAAAAKPGEPIVPGSVQFAPPQLVEDVPGQLTYRYAGTAATRAAVGDGVERDRLAGRLAGKGDEEARAILAGVPGVSSSTIEYGPRPFPDRMPFRPSRIDIRLADQR